MNKQSTPTYATVRLRTDADVPSLYYGASGRAPSQVTTAG